MNFFAMVRHGDYEQPKGVPSALLPNPLTAKGMSQATELNSKLNSIAHALEAEIYPIVYSSTLLRAWQTARQFANDSGLIVQQESSLCERSLGSVSNLSIDAIEDIVNKDPRYGCLPSGWKSRSFQKIPLEGAESLIQAGLRVAQCIDLRMNEARLQTNRPQLVVFVGHGAAFRHAAYLFGQLNLEQIKKYSMHHCQPVVFHYDDSQNIEHIMGDWKLRASKGAGD